MHAAWRRSLPHAFEIALAVGVIAQSAALIQTYRTDKSELQSAVAAHPRRDRRQNMAKIEQMVVAAHLFGEAPSSSATAITLGPSGNLLRGVLSSGLTNWQFAIIAAPDGKSALYHPGQTLNDGSVLEQIGADFVVLARAGGREKISLLQNCCGASNGSGSSLMAAANAGATAISADTRSTLEVIGLAPVPVANGELGLSGSGPSTWRSAGLRSTDVIVAIDGMRVADVLSKQAAIDRAVQAAVTTLTIERDGQELQLEAQPPKSAPPRRRRRV